MNIYVQALILALSLGFSFAAGAYSFLAPNQDLRGQPTFALEQPSATQFRTTQTDSAGLGGAADVLYVGDSHSVGCFGSTLYGALQSLSVSGARASSVTSVATCGSATSHWLQASGHQALCKGFRKCAPNGACTKSDYGSAESLQSLVTSSKPRVVVVALGTNNLPGSLNSTLADAKNLIAQIKSQGATCVWVGPPQVKEKVISISSYLNFVEQLKQVVQASGCNFVDSENKTSREDITDPAGFHYNCNDGKKWALSSFSEIQGVVRRGQRTTTLGNDRQSQ